MQNRHGVQGYVEFLKVQPYHRRPIFLYLIEKISYNTSINESHEANMDVCLLNCLGILSTLYFMCPNMWVWRYCVCVCEGRGIVNAESSTTVCIGLPSQTIALPEKVFIRQNTKESTMKLLNSQTRDDSSWQGTCFMGLHLGDGHYSNYKNQMRTSR